MVFGKELSGQISFAAAEFYAKDFLKAGHRHFCRCPAFSWHRFWVLRFCSTAFCRCHFYFYGFLTDACLSAFRRLPFCFFDTLFHTSQLCRSRFVPWRFSRPTGHGTLSKVEVDVRWTFFRTDLYGWTEGKTSCLDTPDGGRKYPCRSRRRRWGVDKFFTTLYNIYCNKKPHNMACKTKITNILYYITGESYGYFSEML